MKKLSNAALAALLFAGTASIAIATPAFAKKKEEAPKQAALSKEVFTPAAAIDAAGKAREAATDKVKADADYLAVLRTNVPPIEAAAKTDFERYIGQAYRFQLVALEQGTAGSDAPLAAPLDALLANTATPKEQIGRFAWIRANIAFNAKQFPVAIANYQRARDSGWTDAELPLRMAKAKILGGDAVGGVADIEKAVAADKAAGKPVNEDLYLYAITSLQKTNDNAAVQRWTREWLHAYGTPKNWRTAIYVFGFQGAGAARIDKKQRVDLFRLMRATKGLAGQADYIEYGDLTQSIGLASEAQAVIKEGQDNKKIPAGNKSAIEILGIATKQAASEGSIDAQKKAAVASKNGKLAADTGDFCLGRGDNTCAIEMYRLGLEKKGVDEDEVNTHLGIALAATGDKAGAKAAFALVKAAPRNEIATLWTTWIDAPAQPAA